ncbi:MAG: hypothetical protein U5J64_07825 [Halobacteriales archaeon]|nr:hypothetical protein [Halobacteriales archaeon]
MGQPWRVTDVIHVFPATDQAFRNQHGDDYKDYVRQIIYDTNDALEEEFENERPTPHLVITTLDQGEWGEWDNPNGPNEVTAFVELPTDYRVHNYRVDADTPLTEARQMRKHLEWPVRDGEVDRRGADVLSGFSGQPMGADPDSAFFREYIDARSGTAEGERYPGPLQEEGTFDSDVELTGGVTMVGTKDPDIATNPDTVPNIYMHELGHVLGAIHPNDTSAVSRFEVPSGTNGVMCKTSCLASSTLPFGDEGDILTAEFFSPENKDRILYLDYDYKDADKDDPYDRENDDPLGSTNEPRNLTSVATAASTPPKEKNVDLDE